MGHFIKANRISRHNLKMMKENIRIPFLLLLVVLYMADNLFPIVSFSRSVQIDATPYAFVFLINNYQIQFIITACTVILFCNAPFEDESYQYMITRAGRLSWGMGQVLYIVKMSAVYIGCLFAASILPFLGHLSWSDEWGKIWGTLAKGNVRAEYGIKMYAYSNIIRDYNPIQALGMSVLLEFACILFIGLVIYFGNKITGRSAGTVLGAFLAVLDVCVANDWADWAYGFSPASLAQLNLFYGYASKWGINLNYAGRFFLIVSTILGILCIAANYKEKIIDRFSRRHTYGR